MRRDNKREDLVQEVLKLLPGDVRKPGEDLKKNIHAALSAGLVKMDLVTREEFDIQAELLSRTRALLDELETSVRELESKLNEEDS